MTNSRAAVPAVETELGQLFEEHQSRIFRAAYRILGNTTDAEDVLQQVFLRVVRHEVPPDQVGNMDSYLYRSAINAALDLGRSRWRRSRVALTEVPTQATAPGADTEPYEIRNWLRQALTALSGREAEIFVLRHLEGYENREIAEMLATSQAVVAVSLFRARGKLKKELRKLTGGVS
ncbi:MAG TPA: sigma-70 family RNA polymerase sigma factor [Polyangia bacterium]